MKEWEAIVVGAASLAVVAGVSYLLALAGEPQAVWFWRDILGVIG